jgi:hypothetical protein
MTRRRPTLLLLPALLLLPGAFPSAQIVGAPHTLSDSTVVEQWTLDNGLRVVTRHVPDAAAVAITLAYAFGTDDDPPGKEGLAMVLGHLAFTAPAGDIPERSRDDLDSQRPMGWSFPVSRRTTLLTEIASVEQFPGVLGQVAGRMRGVQVTKEALQTSLKEVQKELAQQLFGPPQIALYHQTREIALERKDEDILRRASGRGIARLSPAEVQQQLARGLVPANAVLSLAGNLSEVEVRPLVKNLFGSIPGGVARPPRPLPILKPRSRVMRLAGATGPAGALGLIAPALDDSLHPSFYLNALLMGNHFGQVWKARSGGAPTYHYAVFDEPDLARVFPPVDGQVREPSDLATRANQALNALRTLIVTTESYEELRSGAIWMLGGAMDSVTVRRARREPMVLHSLARTMASRALWGGEAFWKQYRERFASQPAGGLGRWLEYFQDPRHQVVLLVIPGSGPPSSQAP